jgi:hypothetical protein
MPKPKETDWLDHPVSRDDLKQIRQCVHQQIPFGTARWRTRTADKLGSPAAPRPRGRPSRKRDRSN